MSDSSKRNEEAREELSRAMKRLEHRLHLLVVAAVLCAIFLFGLLLWVIFGH